MRSLAKSPPSRLLFRGGLRYASGVRIDVLTLFPGMFAGPLTESILKRGREKGLLTIGLHDIRAYASGVHRQVDDRPYGGGAGMLMMCEPLVACIEAVTALGRAEGMTTDPLRLYLSPRGERLTQQKVETLAQDHAWLVLLCGHYEGIDQRVIDGGWIDAELSIGDYVLTGGELPAMVLIDAIARHVPGVLGKDESAGEETFSAALERKREYPHYTRPDVFRGLSVPPELLSGNHAAIARWRAEHLS